MSLFGYVVAVLNLIAAGAFLYLAALDYSVRQSWSYAVYRYELALHGLPADRGEVDEGGRPKYLNLDDALCRELTGSDEIKTQEEFLDARRAEIQNRIDDPNVKAGLGDPARAGQPVPKYVEVLVPLARDLPERESLFALLSARDPAKLAEQFNEHFRRAKEQKDRDVKRRAIARILVALVDALPTEDEKKQRAEDAKKAGNQRPDPTADAQYRRMLGAVGAKAVAAALDEHAHALLDMAYDVYIARNEARRRFADAHDAALRELEVLEDRLQAERDQLLAKQKAAADAEALAEAQKKQRDKVRAELDEQRAETAKMLERLTQKQEELFQVRVRLRDANRINQRLEEDIRSLERKAAKP